MVKKFLITLDLSKKYSNFIRRLTTEASGSSDQKNIVSISKNYEIDLLQISSCFRTDLRLQETSTVSIRVLNM